MADIYVEAPIEPIPEDEQRITWERYIRSLSKLGLHVSRLTQLHRQQEIKNQRKRMYISLPAMIFSALVVFDKIVQFSKHAQDPECSPNLWLQIVTTILAFCTLVLVTVRDFLKIDENKEKNSKAAARLEEFFYAIDTLRNTSKGREGDRLDIINSLRKQYATIRKNNVTLLDDIDELHFTNETPKNSSTSSSNTDDEHIIECRRETGLFIDEIASSAPTDEPLTTPRTTMNIGYQLSRMNEEV